MHAVEFHPGALQPGFRPIVLRNACVPMPAQWFADVRASDPWLRAAPPPIVDQAISLYRWLVDHDRVSCLIWVVDFEKHVAALARLRRLASARDMFTAVVTEEIVAAIATHLDPAALHAWRCADPHVVRVSLARPARGRRFFLANMLPEMIGEIARHLDASSLRAWKRADPFVARTLRTPPPAAIDWESLVRRALRPNIADPELAVLCEAAYAGDVQALRAEINEMETEQRLRMMTSADTMQMIARASAMGGSAAVVGAFRSHKLFFEFAQRYCLLYARWDLARFQLGMSMQDICWYFLRPYKCNQKMVYQTLIDNADATHLLCLFRTFTKGFANSREWPHNVNHFFGLCVRAGFTDLLARWPHACSVNLMLATISHGTSAASLHWMQAHRPELFGPTRSRRATRRCVNPIPHRAVRDAMATGAPSVLQWLVDHGHLNLWADDADKARYILWRAGPKRNVTAVDWLRDQFVAAAPNLPPEVREWVSLRLTKTYSECEDWG